MFGFFFTAESPVTGFEQVTRCDLERFQRFYHTEAIIDETLDAAERVFATL